MLLQLIYLAFYMEMMYYMLDEMTETLYDFMFMYYLIGGKQKMPQGKGSYGHQRGRPPKKAKKTPKTSKKGKKGSKKGKKW